MGGKNRLLTVVSRWETTSTEVAEVKRTA